MGAVIPSKARDPLEGFEVFKKYKFSGIKLGVGETSQVHEAYDIKTDDLYAVKIIVKEEVGIVGRSLDDVQREFELMSKMRHSNICRYQDRFEDSELLFYVLEYCEGGSLFEKLESEAVLEESVAKPMVKEMVEAVAYLHHKDIMHRDLRPENWLLSDLSEQPALKLTHFRLAVDVAKEKTLEDPCGTLHYVAPEVLRGGYTKPADVWTLGVLFFLMMYGSYPFDGETSSNVMTAILSQDADWSNSCYAVSPEAKDFLKKLLTKQPGSRTTLREIAKHLWLPKDEGRRTSPSFLSGSSPSFLSSMLGSLDVAKKNRNSLLPVGGQSRLSVGDPKGPSPRSSHLSVGGQPRSPRSSLDVHSAVELKSGTGGGRRISHLVTTELLKSANGGAEALIRASTNNLEEIKGSLTRTSIMEEPGIKEETFPSEGEAEN